MLFLSKKACFSHQRTNSYFQVPEIRDEETYSPPNRTAVLDWKPSRPVSRSSSVASTRKHISALTPQVTSSSGEKWKRIIQFYFMSCYRGIIFIFSWMQLNALQNTPVQRRLTRLFLLEMQQWENPVFLWDFARMNFKAIPVQLWV